MKICLINSLYEPYYRGGVEVVVHRVIDGLKQLNHEVILITLGRKNDKVQFGNLTIYRVNPRNIFSFLDINKRPIWLRLIWHPLDVFNFFGRHLVKKILKQEKPDLVITHNLKGIGYLVPRVIKKLGFQHIHTIHDVQLSRPSGLLLFNKEKPFLVIDKLYEKICRWLFNNPDIIVSPSAWLLDYYKVRGFFYESKKAVLPNPIVFEKVEKLAPAAKTDKLINLLYVGQLESAKGIDLLIAACQKLKLNNWHLTIVGSGSMQAGLSKSIGSDKHFSLAGYIEPEKLLAYYRQADLTVVPSLCYENSPVVIYDSLVANVPVIASDIGGIGELVKDNYNGFTFTPGNEKNLVEVLEHFLAHPELIEKLRKNCFISVRNFSTANYIKQLLQLRV